MLPASCWFMPIASPLTTEAEPILQRIEVASSMQIPNFHIIGLPAPEVAEARERVRAAMSASGWDFPKRRIVVNLSPASIRKHGTSSDLAIALAVLSRSQEESHTTHAEVVASGELGLDGQIKPVGSLMRTLYASWREGAERIILSQAEASKAYSYLELLKNSALFKTRPPVIIPTATLKEAWDVLQGSTPLNKISEVPLPWELFPPASYHPKDELLPLPKSLERTLCLAASGQHHILMLGPRGTGKSHAVEWLIQLQPPTEAAIQVHHILIQELAEPSQNHPQAISLLQRTPVRRISSRVRAETLIGGISSSAFRAGEFSLAHGGMLVADELPEWSRDSREAFREPLERGRITITRSHGAAELPAAFNLVANGNLCPCGGWPVEYFESRPPLAPPCTCKSEEIRKYLARLSGPLLDRIDMVLLVARGQTPSKTSLNTLRSKIFQANELAKVLWGKPAGALEAFELETLLKSRPSWEDWLGQGTALSARSRHKVLRIALTLGIWNYLEGSHPRPEPAQQHFAEALFLRPEFLNL